MQERTLMLVFCTLLLASCGQKGPLILPDQIEQPKQSAEVDPSPTKTSTDEVR